MRILLLTPQDTLPAPGAGKAKARISTRVPLGAAYLKACLEFSDPGTEVRVIECILGKAERAGLLEEIEAFSPDLIGITVLTANVREARALAVQLRERLPRALLIAGGMHAWSFPEELLSGRAFDAVVVGEAERLLPLVVKAAGQKRQLESIEGVVTLKNLSSAAREPVRVECLDTLPFPLRGSSGYHRDYGATTCVSASRGCPYGCVFCAHPVIYGKKVRSRSAKNVLAELAYCQEKLDVDTVYFTDSNFTLDHSRVRELCEGMLSSGIRLRWVCQTRPDLLAGLQDRMREMLSLMRKAGCAEVHLGIESGSEGVRSAMGKAHPLEEVRAAVKGVRGAGIRARGLFVLGCPGETAETIRETVSFARSLDLDAANFEVVTPHPGTALYRSAAEKGYLASPDYWMDDLKGKAGAQALLNLPGLSAEETAALQRKAVLSYYLHPLYMLRRVRRSLRNPGIAELKALAFGTKDILGRLARGLGVK